MITNLRTYTAEFISTFALVFFSTGAIIIDHQSGGIITHPGMAITSGLIVMSMIYALGDISGAHMNPAVTLAFFTAKRFPVKQLFPYAVSQLSGAILASVVLHVLFPSDSSLGSTHPSGSQGQSFLLEFLLSFFLMLVILRVATGSKEKGLFAGLAIGAVVLMEALFAGPICGASMNPFRSLAPAIVSGNLNDIWIYLTAPVAGMMMAVPLWNYLSPSINEQS